MGTEYSFASGSGIFESPPKVAPGARFREQIPMGAFDGGQTELSRALDDLRDSFGPDDYNLIRKNCNSFASALCWKLMQKKIPPHVNRLADLGVCCSCLLPKQLLEEAPVGDPNARNGSNNTSGSSYRSGVSKTNAFTGSGARLGSSDSNGKSSAWTSGWAAGRKSPEDDLTDRREKARKAALARLEKNKVEQQQ